MKILSRSSCGVAAMRSAGAASRPCCATPRHAERRLGTAVSAGTVGKQGGAASAGLRAQAPRAAAAPEAWRAQRADHPARRRRIRPGIDVRRRDEHADAQPAREPGRQLQHLPHHVDLLADARGAADRAQPPARRQRHDRRARGRLGRLHRRDPEDLGHDARSAALLRLQDGGVRQVAQHAGRPDHGDGTVRSLADRSRLRLFLRFPRRRNLAMGAAAGREHHHRRAAARREVPPERGHGAAQASPGCASIAPSRRTSRSSCTGRPARRTGRIRSARNGPASTRASSTTAGMRTASASSRARSSSAGSRPTRKLTPRAAKHAVLGQHSGGAARRSSCG